MPQGHIKQYLDLVNEAQDKRMRITRKQEQQIAKMYADIATDFGKSLGRKNQNTLNYRWIKDYAKALKRDSKDIFGQISNTVGNNMLLTTKAIVGAQDEFWGGINPKLSEKFKDVFSTVPQQAVNELMNGGIYKDFTGLSERIWDYKKEFNQDIGYIINRGITAKKSAFDLAKDVEIFLNPKAKKPFDWAKVYPGCNKKVDYSAQRLARTSVTHAYQLSFQRSTVDNPFIEKYKWLSSNGGRTCELCRKRNGALFDKDLVPLDHPNGMCVIIAVINKTYDEIADELSDWANGGNNPVLDRWLLGGDQEGDLSDKVYMLTHLGLKKQLNSFDRQLRLVENQDVKQLLRQAKNRVIFRQSADKKSKFNATHNIIYISEEAEADTLAHELFHEIDATYGITQNGALTKSLMADYQRLILSSKDGGNLRDMLYYKYPESFGDTDYKLLKEYRGISDIINGLSNGDIRLGFRHSKSYWKVEKNLEAETWAQFGRMFYAQDEAVLSMLKEILPQTYEEVVGITERMIK